MCLPRKTMSLRSVFGFEYFRSTLRKWCPFVKGAIWSLLSDRLFMLMGEQITWRISDCFQILKQFLWAASRIYGIKHNELPVWPQQCREIRCSNVCCCYFSHSFRTSCWILSSVYSFCIALLELIDLINCWPFGNGEYFPIQKRSFGGWKMLPPPYSYSLLVLCLGGFTSLFLFLLRSNYLEQELNISVLKNKKTALCFFSIK